VIVAGKTGGHIFPGMALARQIRARRPNTPIVFIGTGAPLEQQLVVAAGFELESIRASGFVGRSLAAKVRSLADLPAGFLRARSLLVRHRARAVAGTGGYVSVPVLAAARSLRIPTLVFDSDAQPGLATRLTNRFATRTAVGIAQANARLARPGRVTGTPVRAEFFEIRDLDPRSTSRRLLVFGGSQGSIVLNRVMAEASARLSADGFEAVHQTGAGNLETARRLYEVQPRGWRLEPFLPRLYEELAWADLVICRAGAMTLAEICSAGRPAILVPFAAAAHGHQSANARALEQAGAATVIDEAQLSADTLAAAVRRLFEDRTRLAEMGRRARALSVPGSAERLADLLFEAEEAP
jgi:UDP-N-acetylglucosamine--N-acetylmuramyl-(pentapeptide) pyrophosphoryl-undecaprenol N-acetylglucosamine transferase